MARPLRRYKERGLAGRSAEQTMAIEHALRSIELSIAHRAADAITDLSADMAGSRSRIVTG